MFVSLCIAKEAWEEQPSMLEDVQDMLVKIDRVTPIVKEHMQAAQAEHSLATIQLNQKT